MNEPSIVRAGEDDVRAFAARRWPAEQSRRLYLHFAERSVSGTWIARDAGTAIGIGFAHALEDEWYLSELYVEPSYRRSGIGWRILQEVMRDCGDVLRSGFIEADDLGAIAFFLRRGVSLQTPVVRIAGAIPREEELARMASGEYRFRAEPLEAHRHGFGLDALDREIRGTTRSQDHLDFAQAATGTTFFLNEECVGYAYVWPDGRIGPLAAASGAYLVQFLGFSLAQLHKTYGATWCMALVPGNNVRVLRAAMRAGLTIDQLRVFATDQTMLDLSRYIGFHALAF